MGQAAGEFASHRHFRLPHRLLNTIGMERMPRDLIFFCYSRADNQTTDYHVLIKAQVELCLRNMSLPSEIRSFSDKDILPGQRWRDVIGDALRRTRVAVLLEGPGFLLSEFIMNNELPSFLEAERNRAGITIFRIPVIAVSEYAIPTALKDLNTGWSTKTPLGGFAKKPRQQAIVGIVDKIVEASQRELVPTGVDRGPSPFQIIEETSSHTIEVYPGVIRDWVQSSGFRLMGVELHPGLKTYLEEAADRSAPLSPSWSLRFPEVIPDALKASVPACAALEQRVARLYPRFRDAQLALFACLHDRAGKLNQENICHAKGVMKAVFRRHDTLWKASTDLHESMGRPTADDEVGMFLETCRCIPLCELGILQKLGEPSENSQRSCYILLDRICHWLLMINRLMNRVPDVPDYILPLRERP